MKLALGRIASILIVALGWVLFGVRTALDFIGYSTAPEDLEVARTRLERGLDLLLATPWWALLGFALASTALLIWRSWPHARQPSGDDRATQAIPIDQLAAQRALDDLFAEGVAYRNKLLPIQAVDLLTAVDTLRDWSGRVLSRLDAAGIPLRTRSRFRTLDRFEPKVLVHTNERLPGIIRLEAIWNKKLELLREIIDGFEG